MMMKKIFLFLLTVAITGIVCLWRAPSVQAVKTNGKAGDNITWNFDASTGTLSFTGSGEMVLPSYASWNDYREDVKAIVIGEGITSIGHGAFSGLGEVTSVSLPESLLVIEDYAFRDCYKLTQITFHDNLTTIGDIAFDGCSSLTEVVIPPKVTTLGNSVFSGCLSLKKLVLHDRITTIGRDAFSYCWGLTELVIPDSVTEIGENAFDSCKGLTKVSIGKNVRKMNAFYGCSNLTEITIPDSVQSISGSAFSHCENLKKITIGAGVSEITHGAFDKCIALKEFSVSQNNPNFCSMDGVIYSKDKTKLVLLPRGISGAYTPLPETTTIGKYAGYECEGLTSLTIPANVKTIEDYAFSWCTGLTSITLQEGVSKIGYRSFAWCKALPKITFPNTLVEIGMDGFGGCVELKEITFTGAPVNIKQQAFLDVKATVYYPGKILNWRYKQDLYGGLLTWVALNCEGAHQEQTLEGRAPTCTDSGLTTGKYCTVCGEKIEQQKTIAATGHNYGQWQEIQAATEAIPGVAQRTCSVCGNVEKKYTPTLTGQMPTDPAGNTVPVPEDTESSAGGNTEPATDGVAPTGEENVGGTDTTPSTSAQQTEDTKDGPAQDTNGKTKEKAPSIWMIIIGVVGIVLLLGVGCVLALRYRKREV